MNANQPLGTLAHAVIEQFGDRAQHALGSVAEKRRTRNAFEKRRVSWRLLSEQELANQPLRPGNWVTIGAIREGGKTTLLEFNLSTWEVREVRSP